VAATRTLTLWCPDWPLVAHGVPADEPAVVLVGEQVLACSAGARAEGVRRGLRRREAQRRCPSLHVFDRDELQEMRAFEPLVTALDAICPHVEVIRPGLCVFATKGPARYFGGDVTLATLVADTVRDAMPTCATEVGIADGRFASILAARTGTVVPIGGSAAFLASFPVTVLDRPALTDLFVQLGLRTLGDVATLPARQIASRFGADGSLVHRLARGLDENPIVARSRLPELAVQREVDPPVDQIEPLAFVGKALANELQAQLSDRGLACTRVLIEAETEHGERRSRLWRHNGDLTAAACAQRVRWQLAGWLTGPVSDRPSAGIVLLRLVPDEVHRDVGQQLLLFGGTTGDDERAAAALTRLQGLLGFDAVHLAVPTGGRSPADCIRLVPWGEPQPAAYDGTPPWPGRLPAPNPTVVYPEALPATVVDAAGSPVRIGDRGAVSASPHRLSIRPARPLDVTAWAGPWPVDERWWDISAHAALARFQLVTTDGTARLLAVSDEQWWVEGTYD
jgi:protein ImuB